jgi:hypothetical protein
VRRVERDEAPRNRHLHCGSVSANFRVVNPADFRIRKAEGSINHILAANPFALFQEMF